VKGEKKKIENKEIVKICHRLSQTKLIEFRIQELGVRINRGQKV
jgi:hypothetical protein